MALDLRQRIGGVPVYVWGIGGTVVGAGVFVWYKRRKAASGTNTGASSAQDQFASPGLGGGGGGAAGDPYAPPANDFLPIVGGTFMPPPATDANTAPTPAPTPASSPAALLPITGSLNNQPVFTTPQGFTGQLLQQAPGVDYSSVVDLVDPKTGLAAISGIAKSEADKYKGYNVVPHFTAPVPTGS